MSPTAAPHCALTAEKVVALLRQGHAIRGDVERRYARLQQITAEDLQFTSR